MTDILTATGVAVLGGLTVFFLLTFLRLWKSGPRITNDVLRSGFTAKTWWNGSLPPQGRGSTVSVAEGVRARATSNGLVITSTRTLSREIL